MGNKKPFILAIVLYLAALVVLAFLAVNDIVDDVSHDLASWAAVDGPIIQEILSSKLSDGD